MIAIDAAVLESDWLKKEVPFHWEGHRFGFVVAQELFSSHTVDSGTMLLLRSLDPAVLPESGVAVDFGCGYGVLGIAVKAARPGLKMTLIDRDWLAVAFSQWNAERLGIDVTCRGGLGVDGFDTPVNLVLWNVPGKAGADVLQRLTRQIGDRLAPGGMLALVVVHPLARDLESVAIERQDLEIEHESAGPEHTVFHIRKVDGAAAVLHGEAFREGTFDRAPETVDTGLISYTFRPVVGLPMYEGPDHATVLLTDAIEGVRRESLDRAVCLYTGQGHVPMYLRARWPGVRLTIVDRDALAIAATRRAVGTCDAVPGVSIPPGVVADVACAMIPDQTRAPVMHRMFDEMLAAIPVGGHLAVRGGSTEVSRFLAMARKEPALKIRGKDKTKGFSAAIWERVR
jgi:16S rRNA G1207 methylase RsmC